jgi:hypothetical protein
MFGGGEGSGGNDCIEIGGSSVAGGGWVGDGSYETGHPSSLGTLYQESKGQESCGS